MATMSTSSAAPANRDPMIGQIIFGDLRITECLARGGTGAVYKAVEPSTDHRVAVKVLDAQTSEHDDAYRCFRSEVLSLARMTHPHAVRLYDWGRTDDGHWYIVMEFLQGRPLEALLRQGPIPIDRCLKILDDVAAVLEEAHGLGIVHRDIKPANIILQRVGSEEYVRLLDFGIARLSYQPSESDRPSGTPVYIAPEQILGVEIDGRADIYALGVVAYECLSGRPPFEGVTPNTLMARHLEEVPQPLDLKAAHLDAPPGLAEYVAQMLEKDPELRPSTMREVRLRLAEFRSLYAVPVTSSITGLPAPRREHSWSELTRETWLDSTPPTEPPTGDIPQQPRQDFATRLFAASLFVLMVSVGAVAWVITQSMGSATATPAPIAKTLPAPQMAAALAGAPKASSTYVTSTGPTRETPPPSEPDPTEEPSPLTIPEEEIAQETKREAMNVRPQPRLKTRIRRAPMRNLRVCYEFLGTANLANPSLSVDGRRVDAAPKDRCFRVRVTFGTHAFTLLDGDDVRIAARRKVAPETEGVFFLVD